jgi:hypothetical protein
MEHQIKYGTIELKPVKKKDYTFLMMNIFLLIILPLLTISGEVIFEHGSFDWALIGKWFIFWAVGIRLFTAGINQASNPRFTARIFQMKSQESFIVIKELGFANISMGIMGILSVININWRPLAAIVGGLYLGFAGFQHLFKKPDSRNEVIAMLYDLCAFVVISLYLGFTVFF